MGHSIRRWTDVLDTHMSRSSKRADLRSRQVDSMTETGLHIKVRVFLQLSQGSPWATMEQRRKGEGVDILRLDVIRDIVIPSNLWISRWKGSHIAESQSCSTESCSLNWISWVMLMTIATETEMHDPLEASA